MQMHFLAVLPNSFTHVRLVKISPIFLIVSALAFTKAVIASASPSQADQVTSDAINAELPKPLLHGSRKLVADVADADEDAIVALRQQRAQLQHQIPRPTMMDVALQLSAREGLDAMTELYGKIVPDIIRHGHLLEQNHPASLLSKFSESVSETLEQEMAAYATISATKAFRKNYKYFNELARQAHTPRISLRRTALEGLCPPRDPPTCMPASERYRTHDGTCNSKRRPRWGAAQMPFNRFLPPEYGDGVDSIRNSVEGGTLASSRFVSLLVHGAKDGEAQITLMTAQWGQLIDHDITSTAQPRSINGSVPSCCGSNDFHPSCFPIKVPLDDPWLSPLKVRCLEFLRSAPAQRRDCILSWREQTNQATSYIDASPIYSNSAKSSDNARIFRNGLLVFGRGNPAEDVCQRGAIATQCIRSGDGRSGEQPGLLALHHVWVGEHNRIATELGELNLHWSDEKIYQETRRIIGAMFQHITYREFLPIVLGREVCKLFDLELLSTGYYQGYDPKVNPTVANSFAAAAFRFGHSLVQNSYMRCDRHHNLISNNVSLHEEFQRGDIGSAGSLHRLLRGMANQRALKRDEFITPELTNHLFQTPGFPFGLDLAAINIQRGRDHGVPAYTSWRVPCGLSPINSWEDLENVVGPESAQRISHAYRSVHDIDLFVGGIAERPVVGGLVGPTFACIIAQQFSNSRRGDRFWYENGGFENSFTPAQLHSLRRVSLAQVLCRSVSGGTFQPHVFIPADFPGNERQICGTGALRPIDLGPWQEQDPFSTATTATLPTLEPENVFHIISSDRDPDTIPSASVQIIKENKAGFSNRVRPVETAENTVVALTHKPHIDLIPNASAGFQRPTQVVKVHDKLDIRQKVTASKRPLVTAKPISGVNNKLDKKPPQVILNIRGVTLRRPQTTRRTTVVVNNIPIELRTAGADSGNIKNTNGAKKTKNKTIEPKNEVIAEDKVESRTEDSATELGNTNNESKSKSSAADKVESRTEGDEHELKNIQSEIKSENLTMSALKVINKNIHVRNLTLTEHKLNNQIATPTENTENHLKDITNYTRIDLKTVEKIKVPTVDNTTKAKITSNETKTKDFNNATTNTKTEHKTFERMEDIVDKKTGTKHKANTTSDFNPIAATSDTGTEHRTLEHLKEQTVDENLKTNDTVNCTKDLLNVTTDTVELTKNNHDTNKTRDRIENKVESDSHNKIQFITDLEETTINPTISRGQLNETFKINKRDTTQNETATVEKPPLTITSAKDTGANDSTVNQRLPERHTNLLNKENNERTNTTASRKHSVELKNSSRTADRNVNNTSKIELDELATETENSFKFESLTADLDPLAQSTAPEIRRVQRKKLDITTDKRNTTNRTTTKTTKHQARAKLVTTNPTKSSTLKKLFSTTNRPLTNTSITKLFEPHAELRQYQTPSTSYYTRPQKVIVSGPNADQYEIEINIRQTNKNPSSVRPLATSSFTDYSPTAYKQQYAIDRYSPHYVDDYYSSSATPYGYYQPAPTKPSTIAQTRRTKPPTVIYLNEHDDRMTTRPSGLLQTFITFATSGFGSTNRPWQPSPHSSAQKEQVPLHGTSGVHINNSPLNMHSTVSSLSQYAPRPGSPSDLSQLPPAALSLSQTGGVVSSGVAHATSSAVSTGNYGVITGVANTNGADSTFSFNIRPKPNIVGPVGSITPKPIDSGTYGFLPPRKPSYGGISPEYINLQPATATSIGKPGFSGQTPGESVNSPFSTEHKRPTYPNNYGYYKRTQNLLLQKKSTVTGGLVDIQDYDEQTISRTLQPILKKNENYTDSEEDNDYYEYEDENIGVVQKFDRDGYMRPEHMIKELIRAKDNQSKNNTNPANSTNYMDDNYVMPVLNTTLKNLKGTQNLPKPINLMTDALPTKNIENVTNYPDITPKRFSNNILAEDYDDETTEPLTIGKNVALTELKKCTNIFKMEKTRKKESATLAFAPIKLLTKVERPDNWVIFETSNDTPLLPEQPQIDLGSSAPTDEVPMPIKGVGNIWLTKSKTKHEVFQKVIEQLTTQTVTKITTPMHKSDATKTMTTSSSFTVGAS